MSEKSDRSLVLLARRGELEAYGALIQRYQTAVFSVCYRLTGERTSAEDLTQEAFMRAYRRLETFDDTRPFGPWMKKVAANHCLNFLRRNARLEFSLDEERDLPIDRVASDPQMLQQRSEIQQTVRAAVMALPAHYRAVIELRHFHEMSYAEISDALELPLSDVKSHLFRARKRLAERLAAYAQT